MLWSLSNMHQKTKKRRIYKTYVQDMELYPVGFLFFFFQNWNLSQMLNSEQTEKQQEDKKTRLNFSHTDLSKKQK